MRKSKESTETAEMTPFYAVFNRHINDAHVRALQAMKATCPDMIPEIEEADKIGIMSIFQEPSTKAYTVYIALVTAFVNGV